MHLVKGVISCLFTVIHVQWRERERGREREREEEEVVVV
jgi:hypothetical protein